MDGGNSSIVHTVNHNNLAKKPKCGWNPVPFSPVADFWQGAQDSPQEFAARI
jgi:hypothetical protein